MSKEQLEEIFKGFVSKKSVRLFMCQTEGLSLWIGLQMLRDPDRKPTRSEKIKAIRSFPYKPNNSCRCLDCRYLRIFRK